MDGVDGGHEGGVEEVGALDAGGGEDDGIILAFGEFAEAGVDVAADGEDLEVGAESEELGLAAEGAGADFGVFGEIEDVFGFVGSEEVAGVFA